MNTHTGYAERYSQGTYSDIIGPFGVPAAHVLLMGSMLREILAESYTQSFDFNNEKEELLSDGQIFEALVAKYGSTEPSPAEVYNFLIRHIFTPQFKRLDAEKGKIVLNLLDFGCGEGRYLEFYKELAKVLEEHGVALSICFNDLEAAALANLERKATGKFKFQRDNVDSNRFVLGNLSFKTIQTTNPAHHNLTKSLIVGAMKKESAWGNGKILLPPPGRRGRYFHGSMTFFGGAASMGDPRVRLPAINMIHEMTENRVIFDLPTGKFIDTFADGTKLKVRKVNKDLGVAHYFYPNGKDPADDKTDSQYTLYWTSDKEGRVIPRDPVAEISEALSYNNPVLITNSLRVVTADPEFFSVDFDTWRQEFENSLKPDSKVEYGLAMINRQKARHFEEHYGQPSR